jgi:hypothetical protein
MNQNPSPKLYKKIIQRLEQEKIMSNVKRNMVYSSGFLLLSAVGFFVGTKVFYTEAAASGMFNFMMLGFTDIRVLSQSFSEFALSIIQAAPIDTLALVLFLLAVMLGSARSFFGALSIFRGAYRMHNF